MLKRVFIVLISIALTCPAGCGEETDAASPETEANGGDEDDKYAIGGRARPAWIETLSLVTESLSLMSQDTELQRASKLALAAADFAAEHPLLLGYTELTLAFVELRRGKIEKFERLMVRGLARIPADAENTKVALMAAEQSVRRGRLDPSRVLLGLWRKRLDEAGEDELVKQVEDKADEHLARVRGKAAPKEEKVKIEAPPDNFPIVLPN